MTGERTPALTVTKDDLVIQTFRSGGKGGQHQNKTESGVRIIHPASGARGESREERSQHQNKRIALRRLTETPAFKLWVRERMIEIERGESIEKSVERAMSNLDDIRVEVRDDSGRWVETTHDAIAG